jgi:hypothetical protein
MCRFPPGVGNTQPLYEKVALMVMVWAAQNRFHHNVAWWQFALVLLIGR